MLTLKVQNATPPGRDSLCYSCTWAQVVRGFRDCELLVFCERQFPSHKIPFPVRECTNYFDQKTPSKQDMEEIAWEIGTKKIERHTGFVKPSRPTEETAAISKPE